MYSSQEYPYTRGILHAYTHTHTHIHTHTFTHSHTHSYIHRWLMVVRVQRSEYMGKVNLWWCSTNTIMVSQSMECPVPQEPMFTIIPNPVVRHGKVQTGDNAWNLN